MRFPNFVIHVILLLHFSQFLFFPLSALFLPHVVQATLKLVTSFLFSQPCRLPDPRLDALLHPGAVLAFTSYTKTEAEADLERFTSQCQQEVEILTSCEQNKMRSHRPIRDWEMDQENDVFYSNQLLTVVRSRD